MHVPATPTIDPDDHVAPVVAGRLSTLGRHGAQRVGTDAVVVRPAEPGGFQRSARFFGERPGVRAAGGDDERLFPVFRGQRPDRSFSFPQRTLHKTPRPREAVPPVSVRK